MLYQWQKLVIGRDEVRKVLTSTMMKLEKKAVLHSGVASRSDSHIAVTNLLRSHRPAAQNATCVRASVFTTEARIGVIQKCFGGALLMQIR